VRTPWLAFLAVLVAAAPAHAGMPMVVLEDLARMRIQTISFFLVMFLLAALGVRAIWNRLGNEFPTLPRMSYRGALGLLTVWGLLFAVVLTMISGARELLTPGAWEKVGATYRVRSAAERSDGAIARTVPDVEVRKQNLATLREALLAYASANGGRLPPDAYAPGVPEKAWCLAYSRVRYIYVPGRRPDEGAVPLAYEPGVYGKERLVLLADGSIIAMEPSAIHAALQGGTP